MSLVDSNGREYKAGDRVRMLTNVWDDGADHHPPGYFACKGEILVVRRADGKGTFPLAVSHEHITDNSVGVHLNEVEHVD